MGEREVGSFLVAVVLLVALAALLICLKEACTLRCTEAVSTGLLVLGTLVRLLLRLRVLVHFSIVVAVLCTMITTRFNFT